MRHIVCFHLLNDYSGSPRVLKMVLEDLLKQGHRVDLVSTKGGPLDQLAQYPGFKHYSYKYAFSTNSGVEIVRYMMVQLYTFFFALRYLFSRDTEFYINTILPFAPAIAGKLMGKRVVYHYHENAFVKGRVYKILAAIMQRVADKIICVSQYQASFLKRKENVVVVPNALAPEFLSRLRPDPEQAYERRMVLMLSSLKGYKGTLQFFELAEMLPNYRFEIVINDTRRNIDDYIATKWAGRSLPQNLVIYPRADDVVPYYNRASVVLNLSDKDQVIETFGMTVLEALSAGLPVIVPTVGGVAEMVEDGVNGYRIDVANLPTIKEHIAMMLENRELYLALAQGALKSSGK